MREKISKALDYISDRHIAEAAEAKKQRRPYWIGAVAAALALVILVGVISQPATVQAQGLVVAPEYPEMAPYPDESSYINANGEMDEEFYSVYSAWRENQQTQYDQPEGYADSLSSYFLAGIPAFLAGDEGENTVCSPLNIYMALAMLAQTAGGESRRQILDLLDAKSLDALRTQAGYVWNAHYSADGGTALVLANSLWLDDGLEFRQDTVNTLADSYCASVYQGDLGSSEMNAALQSWLNEQTGGLLKKQVKNVELAPETVLALASTIYYRVKWDYEFNKSRSTEGIFHAAGGDRTVNYMNKTLSYGPYYWGEDFAAAYLDLADGGRMWLILPDEGESPADVLESGGALEMILNTDEVYENQKAVQVNLSLPKFDISGDMKLNEKLESLGITDVFSPDTADFSPMLSEDGVWLQNAQHAARVAIDEEGITAAAYTVMSYAMAAEPPANEVDFVLDRPFVFVITSRDNLPLFAGVVNEP